MSDLKWTRTPPSEPVTWAIEGGKVTVFLPAGDAVNLWLERIGCTAAVGVTFIVNDPAPLAPPS